MTASSASILAIEFADAKTYYWQCGSGTPSNCEAIPPDLTGPIGWSANPSSPDANSAVRVLELPASIFGPMLNRTRVTSESSASRRRRLGAWSCRFRCHNAVRHAERLDQSRQRAQAAFSQAQTVVRHAPRRCFQLRARRRSARAALAARFARAALAALAARFACAAAAPQATVARTRAWSRLNALDA